MIRLGLRDACGWASLPGPTFAQPIFDTHITAEPVAAPASAATSNRAFDPGVSLPCSPP